MPQHRMFSAGGRVVRSVAYLEYVAELSSGDGRKVQGQAKMVEP